jgi:hypothetical protein
MENHPSMRLDLGALLAAVEGTPPAAEALKPFKDPSARTSGPGRATGRTSPTDNP